MKKFLKILQITVWALLVAGAVAIVVLAEITHLAQPCKKLVINIDYGAADMLITKKEVDSIILKTAGMVKGRQVSTINTGAIEGAIGRQSYVAGVKVYGTNEGSLFVQIRQREPLLRIINRKYESFYLDESGALLPPSPNFSARVLVANGEIGRAHV